MTNLELEYKKAYVEVLEMINHMPKKIVNLIPKEQLEMFKEYKDKNYKFFYNSNLSFKDQNISEKTKAVLAYLYEDYIKNKL